MYEKQQMDSKSVSIRKKQKKFSDKSSKSALKLESSIDLLSAPNLDHSPRKIRFKSRKRISSVALNIISDISLEKITINDYQNHE